MSTQQSLITPKSGELMPPEVAAAPAVQSAVTSIEIIAADAMALPITTADEYQRGAEFAQRIAGGIAKLEKERLNLTRPIDESKKRIMDFFRVPTAKLEAAQAELRKRMVAFTTEQKRIADEARRVAEEAERQRQAELQRQADEQARIAREAQAKAEQEAQERRDAEAKAIADAQAAHDAGDADAAAAAEDEARQQRMARIREENQRQQEADEAEERARALEAQAAPQAINVPTAAPVTAKGISQRTVTKWEVTDRSKIPAQFLLVDEKAIGALVRAQGLRAAESITGIRCWEEADISVRAK